MKLDSLLKVATEKLVVTLSSSTKDLDRVTKEGIPTGKPITDTFLTTRIQLSTLSHYLYY